jgi:hypothetical protein
LQFLNNIFDTFKKKRMNKGLICFILLTFAFSSDVVAQKQQKKQPAPHKIETPKRIHYINDLQPGASLPFKKYAIQPVVPVGDGKAHVLEDYVNKNGLVVIFLSWTCRDVYDETDHLRQLINTAQNHDINVLFVNSNEATRQTGNDSYNDIASYMNQLQFRVPCVFDDGANLADSFGATINPEVYFFNGKSELVYKGAMDEHPGDVAPSNRFYIMEIISTYTPGVPVQPSVIKPVGCEIKRYK